MRDLCHMRDLHECACKPGECQQQPKAIPAPVHLFSVREIISTSVLIGAIAATFAFYSIPRAVGASHHQQLEQQEQITWRK